MSLIIPRALAAAGWLAAAGCSLDASPASSTGTNKAAAAWRPRATESRAQDAAVAPLDASAERTTVASAPSPENQDAATRSEDAAAALPLMDAGAAMPARPERRMPSEADASAPEQPPKMQADASTPATSPAPAGSGAAGTPSPAPACLPGVYNGTFSGSLQAAGLAVGTITGAINTNLTLDLLGLYLNVIDLRVVGADESGNTVTVTVSGNINCATLQLEDGLLTDGKYYLVATRTELAFTGFAQGAYTTSPHALNGTWNVETQGTALLGGNGEFSLTLSR
jgi:hypothetical protein